jgi:hypothetical protein
MTDYERARLREAIEEPHGFFPCQYEIALHLVRLRGEGGQQEPPTGLHEGYGTEEAKP